MTFTFDTGSVINALGLIAVAYFSYNQYAKNKLVDLKIEDYKTKLKERTTKDAESAAIIYGELWKGLHDLKADRVYVIQPHPSQVNRFITVTMEVKKKGVSSIKPNIRALPMAEVAGFVSILAQEKFIRYSDVSVEIIDKQIRSILGVAGVQSLVVHRLENPEGKWIGNICCEHTQKQCWDCLKCEKELTELAKIISPILPDYEG